MPLARQVLESPIRLCKFCHEWKPRDQFKRTGFRCLTCQGNQQRRYSGLPKFYREAAIPGTPSHEKAKADLERLMQPNLLRNHERFKPNGERYHRRPPRFSHLPADVRVRAEAILLQLMVKYADRLEGPNWQALYGSLIGIATRMAIHGRNISRQNYNKHLYKRHLMYALGLIERPQKEARVDQQEASHPTSASTPS